jgi:hypothetical protein
MGPPKIINPQRQQSRLGSNNKLEVHFKNWEIEKGEGQNESTFQDEGLRTIGADGQRWRELLPVTHTTLDYGQHLLEHSAGLALAVCV